MPLVARCAGLIYFQAGRVSGCIIGGVSNSMGFGRNLYQTSCILNIDGSSSLQSFGVALVVIILDPGNKKAVRVPCRIGSSL